MVIACVLRSGGDFGAEHVKWLARQVPDIVCLSDVPIDGVKTIPLAHDWQGWWAKMELFSPLLDGDVMMIDLDTVVRQLPEKPRRSTVLTDFTEPSVIGSGFMFVTAKDRARIWKAWIADPEGHIASCQQWPRWGDQGFLNDNLHDAARWGDDVVSYKVHCQSGVPDTAKVICFHGKPRPWHVKAGWVPPLYREAQMQDFRDIIGKHAGKRIIVMGGGESLDVDLNRIGKKADDIIISTNGHGIDLRKPDYLFAIDHTHTATSEPMGEYLRKLSDAPIISPHAFADYRLGNYPQSPRFVLSGLVATWAAWAMGARLVIPVGMTGYSDNDYRDEAKLIARDIHGEVRVMQESPLADVFPIWKRTEKFGKYVPHQALDGLRGIDGVISIRVRKPCTIGMIDFDKGAELRVYRHEVYVLLKHRMVEEI